MAKFEDWRSDSEVHDIMEQLASRFPKPFDGFDVDGMHFIMTCKKKSEIPLKLRKVGYPMEVFVGKPYIVEIFEEAWKELTPKQRNLAVFHIMCAVPEGGLDPASKHYARTVKPQIVMYRNEFVVAGGVTNWMENDAASDPMDVEPEDVASVLASQSVSGTDPIPADSSGAEKRHPVTSQSVAAAACAAAAS